jgi:hypothetical protein
LGSQCPHPGRVVLVRRLQCGKFFVNDNERVDRQLTFIFQGASREREVDLMLQFVEFSVFDVVFADFCVRLVKLAGQYLYANRV